jgi:hypothetical protein
MAQALSPDIRQGVRRLLAAFLDPVPCQNAEARLG